MALKANYLLTLTILFALTVSCRNEAGLNVFSGKKTELVVAMEMDMPGYFAIGDENFGYQYDLLEAYAEQRGMALTVITGNTASECSSLISEGKADMVAALSTHMRKGDLSLPVYKTSYAIVTTAENKRGFLSSSNMHLLDILDGKRILISAGFKATRDCDLILDSQASKNVFISSRNCLELAEELREGRYDYFICEKSEAQIGCALIDGIDQVYDFSEQIAVNIAVDPQAESLYDDFSAWFDSYRNGKEYAMLNYLYFEKGMVGQLIAGKPEQHRHNSISAYDRVMREVCGREGYDWRLMSAIAYNESRFDAGIVSPRGARGLMQIMPSTARQFNVAMADLEKPEVSIMLAAKLLQKIESALRLPKNMPESDRICLILACYNCGVGHVLDARRLAVKYGADPNSWGDVSSFLEKKSSPEYYEDEAVQCGRFKSGRQTLAFVNNVMGKYDSYCAAVKR